MNKFGIGQSVQRVEDRRFLTGQGRYVDDVALPRQCFGAVVMSPHAHAKIVMVDTAAARAADGVLLVLTGADAAGDGIGDFPPLFMPEDMGGPKGFRTRRPVLARERVRFVGDRVAFVVAETALQARAAVELVEVEYAPLAAVIGLADAVKDGAPRLFEDCPTGNVSTTLMMGSKEATEVAFAGAAHVVSMDLVNTASAPTRSSRAPA